MSKRSYHYSRYYIEVAVQGASAGGDDHYEHGDADPHGTVLQRTHRHSPSSPRGSTVPSPVGSLGGFFGDFFGGFFGLDAERRLLFPLRLSRRRIDRASLRAGIASAEQGWYLLTSNFKTAKTSTRDDEIPGDLGIADLIVAGTGNAARAAKQATTSTPIVMASVPFEL